MPRAKLFCFVCFQEHPKDRGGLNADRNKKTHFSQHSSLLELFVSLFKQTGLFPLHSSRLALFCISTTEAVPFFWAFKPPRAFCIIV